MLAVVLASLGVLAAIYELVAVRTRRVPTVTDMIKAAGWPTRITVTVTAAGALALIDHFVWDGGLI